MVNQSANLQDFLVLGPCCGVLLILTLVVGGVLLMLRTMSHPAKPE
jgi:hypothetical protein